MSDDINPYAAPTSVNPASKSAVQSFSRQTHRLISTPAMVLLNVASTLTLAAVFCLVLLGKLYGNVLAHRIGGEARLIAVLFVLSISLLVYGCLLSVCAWHVWRRPQRGWVKWLWVLGFVPNPLWLLSAPAAFVIRIAAGLPEVKALLDAHER